MNLRQVFVDTRQRLEKAGIEDASLEAEVLLRHVTSLDRTSFYASLDNPFNEADAGLLQDFLLRRLQGEPAAYITGHREFYGLDFTVDNRVLIPRPETELLVKTAIDLCREYGYRLLADIGTGSGVIAVSLAVNFPDITVLATDRSGDALDVARVNAIRHSVADRISFVQGDLLAALTGPVDIICANLPYVADRDIARSAGLAYEPVSALAGGPEGLDIIDRICRQAPAYINPGGSMVLEIGSGQSHRVEDILHAIVTDASLRVVNDLAGIGRLVVLRLTRNQL